MIISHSRKFIYVHLHKTAGEAITAALGPHLGPADILRDNTGWKESTGPLRSYFRL